MRIPDQMLLRGHRGHRHFWQRALSRRQFLGASAAATGAAMTAPLWVPALAEACQPRRTGLDAQRRCQASQFRQ